VALASADAASWRVEPDGAAPADGFHSAFPVPPGAVESFAFAARARQAGVVLRPAAGAAFEWVRYDLRKRAPVARVALGDAKTPADQALRRNDPVYNGAAVSALSPSGQRLAVRDGHGRFVGVWSRDGRRLGTLRIDVARGHRANWVGFGGEDRLWVLAAKRLTLRAVADGKVLRTVPGEVAALALSPGGRWLAACVGQELLFLESAHGKRAGSLPLPAGWGAMKGASVAFHPSGRTVAAYLTNEQADMLLGVWDVATGRLTDSLVQTFLVSEGRVLGALRWAGERRLFCGAALLDLDRHVILCHQTLPPGVLSPCSEATPDGRQWLVRGFTDAEWARVGKKLPRVDGAPTRPYLTASSLPEAVTGPLESAAQAFLWHPGIAVRVVAAKSVPRGQRARVAEGAAEALAKEGYRVDPDAPVTVEVDLKVGSKTEGTGQQVRPDRLTDEQKRQAQFKPGSAWFEKTDVYQFTVQARVLGPGGRPAFQTPKFGEHAAVKKWAGESAAWEKLMERPPDLHLPRLFLRDADHKRLVLPKSFGPGVDGLLEPVVESAKGPVKDGYELPEDG
jgi:hypothetical protein